MEAKEPKAHKNGKAALTTLPPDSWEHAAWCRRWTLQLGSAGSSKKLLGTEGVPNPLLLRMRPQPPLPVYPSLAS